MEKLLEKEYYTVAEVKRLFHVTNATLSRWRSSGKIHAAQPTIRKFLYPREEIDRLLGKPEAVAKKKTVLYCRVSTHAQKAHLERQKQLLSDYCTTNGTVVDEVYSEIASGMNDKRKQFIKLVEAVLAGDVKEVLVTYKDRLTRFGFDFYQWLFEKHGCKLTVVNNPIDQDSTEQEMTDDLVSIIHHFSMKMYSSRRQQLKKCREALKGDGNNGTQEEAKGHGNHKRRVSSPPEGDAAGGC